MRRAAHPDAWEQVGSGDPAPPITVDPVEEARLERTGKVLEELLDHLKALRDRPEVWRYELGGLAELEAWLGPLRRLRKRLDAMEVRRGWRR